MMLLLNDNITQKPLTTGVKGVTGSRFVPFYNATTYVFLSLCYTKA